MAHDLQMRSGGRTQPAARSSREDVPSHDGLPPESPFVAAWQDSRWTDARRILVIRLDNIGDVIMAGPALRALKSALPKSAVTLLATPGGSQVAPMLPWVDDVIVRQVLWQDISGTWVFDPERELDLVAELRNRSFDAAVILTSFTQSPYPPAYVAYLAGIPIRVAQSREFGGGVLSQWVRPLPDDTHQVDRNLHLLESAGFPLAGRHLELALPVAVQDAADCMLDAAGLLPGEPFIAIAPGASAEARRYDIRRYAEVVRRLAEEAHPVTGERLRVVLLGSPRETSLVEPILTGSGSEIHSAERSVDGRLATGHSAGKQVVSFVGQTSVPEMAAVINRAALLIANNSGPLHMADALGRPMVILYSGTEYESQWRPRSAPARLLRRSTFCTPCFAFRCRYRMECLDIAPESVVGEALAMLGTTGGRAGEVAESTEGSTENSLNSPCASSEANTIGSSSRPMQRSYDASLNVARTR